MLRQARAMKESAIIELFEHIGHRQELYGAEKAFRFRSFKHKTKGILSARYPDTISDANESDAGNDGQQHQLVKRVRRRVRGPELVVVDANVNADQQPGDRGNHSDATATDEPNNLTIATTKHVQRRPGGKETKKVVGTDKDAEEQGGDQGDQSDGADVDQQNDPTDKRVRGRTRRRTARRVVSTDEEAEDQGGDRGDGLDAANDDEQSNLTARDVLGQQTSDCRSDSVSRPVGMDQLLLPTPAPSPSPNQATTANRPRPKPRLNPTPSRIQPSRKGKVN